MIRPSLSVSRQKALKRLRICCGTSEEYLRAEKDAAQVRGGMYWKKQGQYEYLV